jgi:hypothetical protein
VAAIKTRFRNALRPAIAATVAAAVRTIAEDGRSADLALALTSSGTDIATANATIRIPSSATDAR